MKGDTKEWMSPDTKNIPKCPIDKVDEIAELKKRIEILEEKLK